MVSRLHGYIRHHPRLTLLLLAVLALFTFAAIGTDDFWSRRIVDDTQSAPQPGEKNR